MLLRILAQAGPESYMPHGMCYLWQQDLVFIHVLSDGLTTLAYWAIPPFLIYLAVQARREIPVSAPYGMKRLPYDWMFVAFGVFIVACGATHAMGIWTIWEPVYWIEGGVKAVTALASVATAIALPPLVPRALDMIRDARESELRRVELEEAHREQEELVEKLREANEAQSRFLANVSHDLRTPLSLVEGHLESVLEDEGLPEEAREELETALRNARTLDHQVEDLLTVAHGDTGEMEPDLRPVSLGAIVRDTAGHYRNHAHGRDIEFTLDVIEELSVAGDPDLLRRAVLNVISNAFKFTPDGGRVRCTVRRDEAGRAEITVADSGPGVPEEEKEQVFDRFAQGRGGSGRPDGGKGLGLAIVREVAEAHGGTVEVADAKEGGARFTICLPAEGRPEEKGRDEAGSEADGGDSAARAPRHPAREQESPDGGRLDADRPTVLVVEDDADMARYLGNLLSPEYRVAFAADGREGLRKTVELTPDLVLTDMMMPEMDGAEMIAGIRERPEMSAIPILVLTARAEEGLPEETLRQGAQDYLGKPVRKEELRARVENLLELTRSRRTLQETFASQAESLDELTRTAARRKEELEEALGEKRVLMRELHHRVKGNLQTITSLLQLELRSIDDERARRSLEETRGRVATMGLLHENLYRSGVSDRMELATYLRRLVADVVRTRGAQRRVDTTLDLREVAVPTDDAVACGLVVHELVTNALRHAFDSGQSGEIRVRLRRRGDEAVLSVSDDGRGVSETELRREEGVGLTLLDSLVSQLEGRWTVAVDGGTEIRVIFPIAEETGRPLRTNSPHGAGDR